MFYSYKPYLQIALSRECIITFNENGVYIAKTPEEEKLLREYAENIIRVREWVKNDPEYIEVSCDAEAKALGGGSGEPVEDRDHAKHIEELKRKYGGDEEPEYSEWDRSLISKIK